MEAEGRDHDHDDQGAVEERGRGVPHRHGLGRSPLAL